jgi:hypothetical protein
MFATVKKKSAFHIGLVCVFMIYDLSPFVSNGLLVVTAKLKVKLRLFLVVMLLFYSLQKVISV